MKDRSHDEAMAELFREDPAFAAEYTAQLLRDGEPRDLEAAQRQMALAQREPCSRHSILPHKEKRPASRPGDSKTIINPS